MHCSDQKQLSHAVVYLKKDTSMGKNVMAYCDETLNTNVIMLEITWIFNFKLNKLKGFKINDNIINSNVYKINQIYPSALFHPFIAEFMKKYNCSYSFQICIIFILYIVLVYTYITFIHCIERPW